MEVSIPIELGTMCPSILCSIKYVCTLHTYTCICTYNITKSGFTKYILQMKEHIWMSKLKAMNNKENKWSNSKRSCRYLVFQKLFQTKTAKKLIMQCYKEALGLAST